MTAEPIVPYAYGTDTFHVGTTRYVPLRGSHEIIADGVRLHLPVGNKLTDKEAIRLAWAILADLAPDDVIATPAVVTYREGTRLEVLRLLAMGVGTVADLSKATGWKPRSIQRRLRELREDGRAEIIGGQQTPSKNIAAVWGVKKMRGTNRQQGEGGIASPAQASGGSEDDNP